MAKNSQVANQKSGRRSFLKGISSELKKVIWPTREELINHEIVVVTFTLLAAFIIWVFDSGFSTIIGALVKL